MKRLALTIILIGFIAGCQTYRNAKYPPGEMGPDGKIYPCHGSQTNPQGCGNALYNAPRVTKLNIGQTTEQAKAIMGHDPEDRSIKLQDKQIIEIWKLLTDYRSTTFTVITFIDGKIVSVETTR
jgi:hypothetical protein